MRCVPTLEFFPNIKWIQIIDFLDVNARHELTDFSDVVQKVAGSVALDVCHHALLVRGCVVVPSQAAVEPDAAAALVGIAVAAQGCMVDLEQLRIGDIQTFLQVADRVVR